MGHKKITKYIKQNILRINLNYVVSVQWPTDKDSTITWLPQFRCEVDAGPTPPTTAFKRKTTAKLQHIILQKSAAAVLPVLI